MDNGEDKDGAGGRKMKSLALENGYRANKKKKKKK
jgi:hypothetical protein